MDVFLWVLLLSVGISALGKITALAVMSYPRQTTRAQEAFGVLLNIVVVVWACVLLFGCSKDKAAPGQHSDEAARVDSVLVRDRNGGAEHFPAALDSIESPDSLPGGALDSIQQSVRPIRAPIVEASAEPAPTGSFDATSDLSTLVVATGLGPGMYALHRDREDHTTYLDATDRPVDGVVVPFHVSASSGVFVLSRTKRCVCENGEEVIR